MDGRAALMMGYRSLKAGRTKNAMAAFETAAAFKKQKKAALKALKAAKGTNHRPVHVKRDKLIGLAGGRRINPEPVGFSLPGLAVKRAFV